MNARSSSKNGSLVKRPFASSPDSENAENRRSLRLIHDRSERRAFGRRPFDFKQIYRAYFSHVTRWIRSLGGSSADVEDIAQEVFIIARRQLSHFDGENVVGWLYKITRYTTRDHRRSAWFRLMRKGGRDTRIEDLPQSQDGPLAILDKKDRRQVLVAILSGMSETLRTTFVLFEIEGYRGQEIALMQDIPVNTVWTRLYHARRAFFELVALFHSRQESEGRTSSAGR